MEFPLTVFISSVISGMAAERGAVEAAIRAIPLSRPWAFEHSPASSLPLQESYLGKVRECDIFVLLLSTPASDPVKLEVITAQQAEKPVLVFLSDQAPPDVTAYAQTLGVKYATYRDASGLAAKVAEAAGDELIAGYRRHSLPRSELGIIGGFLDRLAQGQAKIEIGGDQVAATGPVATRGSAIATGSGPAVVGQGNVVITTKGVNVYLGEAPVKMTEVDRQSVLGRYLQYVISRNRYLQLQGIRSGGRLVHIELDQVYVRLRATRQRLLEAEDHWLTAEAGHAPGELRRFDQELHGGRAGTLTDLATETVTVEVNEALAQHARLVVLGDPGSGKTTLLRYLALIYARDLAEGGGLVREKLGLDEGGWLPILLPLRQIGAFLRTRPDDGTEGHALLLAFLRQALANERIALPDDFFDRWLAEGRAAILLDGLDEVADPDLRRRVARLVESFTQAYPGCRYVVTSRIVGYSGPARLGEGYATTTVRDFTLADVAQFLTNWHRLVAIGQMAPGEPAEAYAAEQSAQLLAAIQASERIRELAINPLMLTVIAMVHRDRVKLPDRRAELYAEAVDVLLGKWEEAKGVKEIAILPDRPFDTGDKRLMLQGLALYMQEYQKKEVGVGELRAWLAARFGETVPDSRAAEAAVGRFLNVIEERTGLLMARGEGVYAFSHLTFQEYLAALAVAARDDYVAYTIAHVADPWWREVILLEAGYLSTQSQERTTRLIRAIADKTGEPQPYHNLVLASECLRDVGSGRVTGNLEAEVQTRLRKELDAPPPVWSRWFRKAGTKAWLDRRGRAIETLARAGAGYWSLPCGEPEWVSIPAGDFWMGSEDVESEKLHQVSLDSYLIARVPITNVQYQVFVEKTGYEAPSHWEEGHPPKGAESHPVVNVNWADALEYCRWLSRATSKHITLPSEAEWEKAARGDKDKRTYPWGDTFDPAKCNCGELGLFETTPVGVFAEGASPYGVLDMAGNVWEWTRSLYDGYPYPTKGPVRAQREDLAASGAEARVLRGGAFLDGARLVWCAVRNGDLPYYRYGFIGFRIVASPVA